MPPSGTQGSITGRMLLWAHYHLPVDPEARKEEKGLTPDSTTRPLSALPKMGRVSLTKLLCFVLLLPPFNQALKELWVLQAHPRGRGIEWAKRKNESAGQGQLAVPFPAALAVWVYFSAFSQPHRPDEWLPGPEGPRPCCLFRPCLLSWCCRG